MNVCGARLKAENVSGTCLRSMREAIDSQSIKPQLDAFK